MSNYKHTLNLPTTTFPMRGNLVKLEPCILHRWYKHDLYRMIRNAKKNKKIFILHDGPPYANGSIHIGHAVNKILKDIIIKFKGLSGFDAPYIPGWDCHGQPIEIKVEQLLGNTNKEYNTSEFRAKCREYAAEQVNSQKSDFKRLGVLGDWNNPYLTMDFKIEANILRTLAKIVDNGYLMRGIKPVHWCPACSSSLSEAEVEYYNKISLSMYVRFAVINKEKILTKFGIKNFIGKCYILIWTTTPWTIPANRAISLHPNIEYQLITINDECLILAADLVKNVIKTANIITWKLLGTCKGINLELDRCQHPFMDFDVPIVMSEHVTLDLGTGAVHIAPGHGPDDYLIGQKYNLEITHTVGPNGCYLNGTYSDSDHTLDGLFVFQANDIIVKILKKYGALFYTEKIRHSYPCCWRHKTPILFRTTPQWFINIDYNDLRKQALNEIDIIEKASLNNTGLRAWMPTWGKAHIEHMVSQRPDWCISRQRTWGVPMSIFVHKDTQKIHPHTVELMELVAQRIEKNGIQAWWDLDIKEILGEEADQYKKIPDTLDVWFDSGSTSFSVVNVRPEFHGNISDIYLEGSDQHRGWFMSSLMISTAINGKAPYRQVLTHGFIVDGQGNKMSKSIGNIISPQDIVTTLGSDILRLWVASTDYTNEMIVSHEALKNSADYYRRIRNTARFLLANLHDFNPKKHLVKPENMVVLDRWAIERAMHLQKKILNAYDHYNFHAVVQYLLKFCSIDMGAFYLDIIKDRQYTMQANSIPRRSCQTALFHISEALVRWISPILSFTADELWRHMPGERVDFVFTEEWYNNLFCLDHYEIMNHDFWSKIMKVRSTVNKVIEQARTDKIIGGSLDAQITLYADNILQYELNSLENELHFVLIISKVQVEPLVNAPIHATQSDALPGLKVLCNKAEGQKCPRCWHFYTTINDNTHLDICPRCTINVLGYGEKRKFA
ncbi:Isoleucine--tRNA ligase [Candidatus Profftia lariciata]|uniref:isoleucine--tRNA ligase n=1 Tax=Candidatus Profftia lariciata TaxID=1987921 RepID=UPI001D01D82E|nr:isoleucine--tRNA ligase [Candidatus Profftia lariciata]UDG81762.1 Isoleucine--tRNA ligase [Candidatus Profftia lariciata]